MSRVGFVWRTSKKISTLPVTTFALASRMAASPASLSSRRAAISGLLRRTCTRSRARPGTSIERGTTRMRGGDRRAVAGAPLTRDCLVAGRPETTGRLAGQALPARRLLSQATLVEVPLHVGRERALHELRRVEHDLCE